MPTRLMAESNARVGLMQAWQTAEPGMETMITNGHPRWTLTDNEIRDLLRHERKVLIQRLITLKAQVRERLAAIDQIESGLTDIESSEFYLDGSANRRKPTRGGHAREGWSRQK